MFFLYGTISGTFLLFIANIFYRYFVPLGLERFEKVPEGRNIGSRNT